MFRFSEANNNGALNFSIKVHDSYLDDEGRVTVRVNGRRGLALRALRGHPRSGAGVAPDAAPGSMLLQIARAPLLSYLQPLEHEKRGERNVETRREG